MKRSVQSYYKQYIHVIEERVEIAGVYLILAFTDLNIGADITMATTIQINDKPDVTARTSGLFGGGCMTQLITRLNVGDTINIWSYGYGNMNYNIYGRLQYIRLAD